MPTAQWAVPDGWASAVSDLLPMAEYGDQQPNDIIPAGLPPLARRSGSVVSRGLAHLGELARVERERAAIIAAANIHEAARVLMATRCFMQPPLPEADQQLNCFLIVVCLSIVEQSADRRLYTWRPIMALNQWWSY